jgi:hypothetical protein
MEEKLRFAKRLIGAGEIPPEVVKFALFDVEQCGLTTAGANRNALLLDSAGEALVSVDDDTLCRIATAPGDSGESIAITNTSLAYPAEVWVYENRDHALKAVSFVEQDFIGTHERFLGKDLKSICQTHHAQNRLNRTGSDAESVGEEAIDKERITVTLNGIIGDCGWSSPFVYLLLTRDSLNRLTQSESVYRRSLGSREVLQVTRSALLTKHEEYLMSTVMGIDSRWLIPPFMPAGRGQDRIFGLTLAACFSQGHVARLPWAVVHAPVKGRSFPRGEIQKVVTSVDLSSIIASLVKSFTSPRTLGPRERLIALGSYLENIGGMSEIDFTEFTGLQILREKSSLVEYLKGSIRNYGAARRFWVEDIERFIEATERSAASGDFTAPVDLQYDRSLSAARRLYQRLVLKFGQLLRWWPVMWERAQESFLPQGRIARPL